LKPYFLAGVLLAAAASAQSLDRIASTRDYLAKLEKLGFSGVVLVADRDSVLMSEGYGLADREARTAWSPRTVTTIGSITKQFTAAAILKLEEAGKLRVEDPLGAHLEGVPGDKAGITLHHLLTHSSGIADASGKGDFDPVSREDIVRLTMEAPLNSPPGERYEYSNAGYSLLGVVIEKLTGKSYETYVREVLFEPAGMMETGYILPAWDRSRWAKGYQDGALWGSVLEKPFAADGPYWVLRANGGIHSTAEDMLRWARALLEGRILSAASLEKLWSPFVDEGGGESHYGYGWSIQQIPLSGKVVTHNGGNGIFFADFAILPSSGTVIFLATNVVSTFPPANNLLQELGFHVLGGQPYPDAPDVVDVDPASLRALAGTYLWEGLGGLAVSVDEGALVIAPATPEAFSRLYSVAGADLAVAVERDRIIAGVLEGFMKGDHRPAFEAYEGRVPMDDLTARSEARRRQEEAEFGPLTGYDVLGTAILEDGASTLVRMRYGKPQYRQYLWQKDATLQGFRPMGNPPRILFHPVGEGRFEAWGGRPPVVATVIFAEDDLVVGEGSEAPRFRRETGGAPR